MIRHIPLLLTAVVVASCAAKPGPAIALKPEIVRSRERFTREYVLQPGDQIALTVFHVPELTSVLIVRPDGYISVPILKDVKVAGMTVPEVDQDLERRFATRLVAPDVTVSVQNPRQASVYVLGEVARPGPVPIRDAATVAEALANAGGATRTAAPDNVAVVRLEDDGYLTGTIIPRGTSGETASYMAYSAVPLRTGDMVIVPENGRSQFVRFITDYINTPLSGISQAMQPYVQYETIRLVQKVTP
jgi:polysaccharide export outer membrane protein